MTELEKVMEEFNDMDKFQQEWEAVNALGSSEDELKRMQSEILKDEISKDKGSRH